MITQEWLESCTDDQIDKGVAWLEANKLDISKDRKFLIFDDEFLVGMYSEPVYYCTNPNDAWPIMMANIISTTPRGSESFAQPYASSGMLAIVSHCENNNQLLRAAMIVYILMSVYK